MTWWMWMFVGLTLYSLLLFGVWAICRAGAKDDEARGRK